MPPVISPLATPSAPRHISRVIAPKISSITTEVMIERIRMRRLAVAKLRSTAPAKRSVSRVSWLNAWPMRPYRIAGELSYSYTYRLSPVGPGQ